MMIVKKVECSQVNISFYLRDISTIKKFILGSPTAMALSSSSVNHLRILQLSNRYQAYEVGITAFVCYSLFFKFKKVWCKSFLPFSDVIGVGKINSRINPHYHDPRNKFCFWILTGVPVYCGAWKVSK